MAEPRAGTLATEMLDLTSKTANYTVTRDEVGRVFTNTSASGAITFSLPAAENGLQYYFVVQAAQELRIDPNGTETISLPSTGVPGSAGKYLTANAIGESVHLVAVGTNWVVMGYTGTWTAEA